MDRHDGNTKGAKHGDRAPWLHGEAARWASAPYRGGCAQDQGLRENTLSTKRSQCFWALVNFEPIVVQMVRSLTVPFCHMASFCKNWLRFGGVTRVC
jgi:hypothetical protein